MTFTMKVANSHRSTPPIQLTRENLQNFSLRRRVINSLDKSEIKALRYHFRTRLYEITRSDQDDETSSPALEAMMFHEQCGMRHEDSLSVLRFATNTKDLISLDAELRKYVLNQPRRMADSVFCIEIINGEGQTALPDLAVQLFLSALQPGKSIFYFPCAGNLSVLVPLWIWNDFIWKALNWWVEAGDAPEHLLELTLQRDVGL
ncbi:hypothetical protein [Pseudomonas fulva]|uniref:hypothetical protein n=1 Tax=Pseudomonas fulva TaxID=47880 RepID=UPI0018AC401A|nr:hypothetical protein [Pseudomonas fulva]MBF8776256.1 hypothetical protein [Pseudomonas fulva]